MGILLGDAFVRVGARTEKLDNDLAGARSKVASWASGLSGSVARIAGGAAVAGIGAVATAVAGIGVAAFNASSELDTATKRIQSQLGLTEEQAENAGEAIKNVFANNFGDSIADVGEAISEVERTFARIGGTQGVGQLQNATESAIALRDAFGIEITESTAAAVELMDKFGLSATEAFDFITAGLQRRS